MSNRDLVKHIEALNLASKSDVKIVTKLEHWADYDIYTPEEFDRYLLEQDYVELYKEVYGIRARASLNDMDDDMLSESIDQLYTQLEDELEDMQINEDLDQLDREWSEMQLAAETEFDGEWDDIAEDFDDVTKVKQMFH